MIDAPKKFPTKQAANRERSRLAKLEKYQEAAARMVEGRRLAAEARARMAAEAEAKREASARLAAARRQADVAVQTYRSARDDKARAERMAYIEDSVRSALKKADAEIAAKNPRTGRPRRLPALHLTSDPANALINALSPWGFAE